MLVDMADKVSQRRQSANSFYLSVNTAIIGAAAYITAVRSDWTGNAVISLAGIAISALWARNIASYKTLNSAKFKVINELEQSLPIAPYTTEWRHLDPDKDGIRHKPFHQVEIAVPWVFMLVHLTQTIRAIPWESIVDFLRRLL